MGGNFDYKKLIRDYKKNESKILQHALEKQTCKILWTLERLRKIDNSNYKIYKRGIVSQINNTQ